MEKSARRPGRPGLRAIPYLAALAMLASVPAGGQDLKPEPKPALKSVVKPALQLAQLRGYSASGTHKCGSEKDRSCVVTGSGFSNCNDATITLQTRDCCPTTAKGGTSSSFVLNYCIPDRL
jgi:hypothetical protein